jgi:hypothetical protein
MESYAAKLLLLFTSVRFLQLIMQLIAFCETIAAGFSTEAHHSPEIFKKLSKSIWQKLVNLHRILDQNVGQDWLWRHLKTYSKELKHDSFIIGQLWNHVLPRLTRRTLGKISQSL